MTTKKSPAVEERLAQLEETVAKMRALGVTEYGDIKLGPPPVQASVGESEANLAERMRDRAARDEERRRDVLFAACSIKPVLTRPEEP